MKTRSDVYDYCHKHNINLRIPKEFDIEKDYYDKGVIRGENLVHGQYYIGKCRNAHIGRWDDNKKVMWHQRYKFGQGMKDKVNYLDNDNKFDLFIALESVDEKDVLEEDRVEI